ncbi:MAG TPA: NUDIX domain-containing protein [Candidatus Saccharimonadales bacterium]|nr:NUDIX domain-containing protein [Candidatus Saccharimonadales bacterium]
MIDWRDRHSVVPAVYILFRRDDEILLLKRANTGYRDGFYSLPAGHLDGGEPAVYAAVREAKEEVGALVRPEDMRLVHTQHRVAESGDHERLNLFFETTTWQGEPTNAEPEKCSEVRWALLAKLPTKLVPELQHFLRHYRAQQPYGDFGFE